MSNTAGSFLSQDPTFLREASDYFKAKPASGELQRFVNDSCKKLGINKPISVLVSDSKAVNAAMLRNKNGNGYCMIFTKPALDHFQARAGGRLSDEIKAIVGHELGHIRKGNSRYFWLGQLPMITFPIIAVIARHMFASKEQNQAHVEAIDPQNPPREKEKLTVTLAKDASVAFLGLMAGAGVAKANSNSIEFYCD